jgi:D-2-hydroxyacid dehydrogenase (NADP+)
MDKLNVLVIVPAFNDSTPHVDEAILRRIEEVSPKISAKDGSAATQGESRGDTAAKEKLDAMLAEADVIYGLFVPQTMLARAPKLKWVQTMSAGVDRFIDTDIWQSPVVLTGVSGIHATPIGEYVLMIMLMLAKKAPLYFELKAKHEWMRFMPSVLRGKTVGILGLGSIGREVARLSGAFGMRVIATRRSARATTRARYVDKVFPPGQLHQLLAESDYVAVTLPLTPETRNIIGEAELNAMKSTGYIINIGRGSLIDESALIRALRDNRIAGAGLDVTAIEPLPADSPLWEMDNVILSPHISGGMEDYTARATDIFCENLRRYLSGKRLKNIIDKKKGY